MTLKKSVTKFLALFTTSRKSSANYELGWKTMKTGSEESDFQKRLADYRTFLWDTEQKVQIEYDKAVMLLSGGALGISFTFLRDIAVKDSWHHYDLLLLAWLSWGTSVTATLASFYTGILAVRTAGEQLRNKTIFLGKPGGIFRWVTHALNFLGGLLFIFGLVFLVIFVYFNQPRSVP